MILTILKKGYYIVFLFVILYVMILMFTPDSILWKVYARTNVTYDDRQKECKSHPNLCSLSEGNLTGKTRQTTIKNVSDQFIHKHTINTNVEIYLRNYIQEHGVSKSCAKRRYLIYSCKKICGGLGDRQRGIITAFLFALLTNRTFIIDSTYPCELETIIEPNMYNWLHCKNYASNVPHDERMELQLIDNGKFKTTIPSLDFGNWEKTVVDMRLNWLAFSKIRQHNSTKELKLLKDISDEDVIKIVLDVLFKPNDRMTKAIDAFFMNTTHTGLVVCAHIRVGKNPSIPTDNTNSNRHPNITTVFSFLAKFDKPGNIIYIASDSDEIKNASTFFFKNIITIKKKIVHVDRIGSMQRNVACEGYYTAVLEQQILARCDTVILTASIFGSMAAFQRGRSDNLFVYNKQTNTVESANFHKLYGKGK
ncbi:uncharacterized protein LOC128233105 [Mya arenaria]|uniref:uncharacterized protein LOC128233105 n=1 Tax=Mya arenaria TaxID=6604 RepID=UPI0022E2DF93|nr:uncharacterized protein LOC128233105 [Mya arenaria]